MDKNKVETFLLPYDKHTVEVIFKLREIILRNLPRITEQLDIPAKMIAYGYGQKYVDLICVIIPSKKGVKLGFNRGIDLMSKSGLLKGSGKISRYAEMKVGESINESELKKIICAAYELYEKIK